MPDENKASSVNREPIRPLLLKVAEACKVLGCSRSQLYILLKNKELDSITIGPQQRRIPYAECEAYVARKLAEARKGAA